MGMFNSDLFSQIAAPIFVNEMDWKYRVIATSHIFYMETLLLFYVRCDSFLNNYYCPLSPCEFFAKLHRNDPWKLLLMFLKEFNSMQSSGLEVIKLFPCST